MGGPWLGLVTLVRVLHRPRAAKPPNNFWRLVAGGLVAGVSNYCIVLRNASKV